ATPEASPWNTRPPTRRPSTGSSASPPNPHPTLPGHHCPSHQHTSFQEHGMSNTQKIAFIGLGIMGLPMAINLAKAGFEVTGYNRSPEKTAELVAAGGKGAGSIPEAVAGADVVITMVPDSADVEAVVTGEAGVFVNAKAGALWIDNSSIRPDVAARLADEARAAGIRPLDAPVSGGEPADFAAAEAVFNAVGKTIVLVGPAGSGQTVKAANQLIVAANIQALSE